MLEYTHHQVSGAATPETSNHRVLQSMIYHVLPVVLSSRLPALPSIRRSISDMRERRVCGKREEMVEEGVPGTPPPGYTSRPGSGSATPERCDVENREDGFSDNVSERLLSSPFAACERGTGVDWKYARQGVNLMTQAYRESTSPLHDMDEASTSLTRQLYIHGMTYLLRGLPTELTPQEVLSLQAAIPSSVVDTQDYTGSHTLVTRCEPAPVQHDTPPQPPSVAHRVTAALVLQMFVLVQLLLPYVKMFLAQAYQFEREHQVIKRVVSSGIIAVDDIGRRGLRLSQAICRMNDGKVGQAVNEVAIWWVKGVTGGVQQGVEAGLRLERQ